MLLDDDELLIQKEGLGIMGNIILLPGSYPFLSVKIPHFVDMALSLILDTDCHPEKGKEALLLVNNFIASFCSVHGKTAEAHPEPIAEAINILENGGFFSKLEDLVSRNEMSPSFSQALSQLLLNLTRANSEFMKAQLHKGVITHVLLSTISVRSISSILWADSALLEQFASNQIGRAHV